ncbi:MAG TPA: VOC family protein [Bryobacteraceae bacterium]|jgi:glyoxylase I family protein|nr:VOC family protein [Bryobacteraceae bacterium]
MEIGLLHHVTLTVTDLDRSRQFYREILGLKEIPRPAFPFPGAWFQVGEAQHLHLIVHDDATFRAPGKGIDTRDVHFAVRVPSYTGALEFLRGKGYRENSDDHDFHKMEVKPRPTAGYPQIYIIDPDRHVIEINADALD